MGALLDERAEIADLHLVRVGEATRPRHDINVRHSLVRRRPRLVSGNRLHVSDHAGPRRPDVRTDPEEVERAPLLSRDRIRPAVQQTAIPPVA